MNTLISRVTIVVHEYDEAIAFFTKVLKFDLLEDTYIAEQDKRWVVVAPKGEGSASVLLARASNDDQRAAVGRQTGGRVAFFLSTDDFWRDYDHLKASNVRFTRDPRIEEYGTVAVFADLYGNLWDLVGPA
jgi:catechol 2,3-dioxygenase-like lactoylglutathione lyase family enzyme